MVYKNSYTIAELKERGLVTSIEHKLTYVWIRHEDGTFTKEKRMADVLTIKPR